MKPSAIFSRVVLLFLLVAIPLTLGLVKRQQTITQHASESEDTKVVALVRNEPITVQDVKLVLVHKYGLSPESIANPEYKKAALDSLIFQKIITQQSGVLGLNISVSDLPKDGSSEQDGNDEIYQAALADKLRGVVTKTLTMDVVGTFLPVEVSPATYAQERKEVMDSLTKIQTLVKAGKTIEEAYNQVKASGSMYKTVSVTKQLVLRPDSQWGEDFEKALAPLKTGEVSDVLESEGGAFLLAKVLSVHDSQYDTFTDWYDGIKQRDVVEKE